MLRIRANAHFLSLLRSAGLFILICLNAGLAAAQTSTFTYQGQLNDGGTPANGQYDLQFKLFDTLLPPGAQQGTTILRNDIQVTNGAFSVTLDFGTAAFPGANRFLEISVRPGASAGAYTTLSPRQQITSTPYAIKSLRSATADGLSSACVNCVTSSQIGSLPTGNSNYIQNRTTQQASANFNISGNGTVGGKLRAASGVSAIASGTAVRGESQNGEGVLGYSNTVIGVSGGSLSGYGVYGSSITGEAGHFEGKVGITRALTVDQANSNDGTLSPGITFGLASGEGLASKRTTGGNQFGLDFYTAFAPRMSITQLGNVGLGTAIPQANLHIKRRTGQPTSHTGLILEGGDDSTNRAWQMAVAGPNPSDPKGNLVIERLFDPSLGGTLTVKSDLVLRGRVFPLQDAVYRLGIPGLRWKEVWAMDGSIHTSDARLKRDVANLGYGLREVMRLRPVTFKWKDIADARARLGLLAQEVEPIMPEVIWKGDDPTTSLGMSYDSLIPVLIKAIQEQQTALDRKDGEITAFKSENVVQQQQITDLQQQNSALEARLAALEQAVQKSVVVPHPPQSHPRKAARVSSSGQNSRRLHHH